MHFYVIITHQRFKLFVDFIALKVKQVMLDIAQSLLLEYSNKNVPTKSAHINLIEFFVLYRNKIPF